MDRLRADFSWSQQELAVPITGPLSLSANRGLWKENSSEGDGAPSEKQFSLKSLAFF